MTLRIENLRTNVIASVMVALGFGLAFRIGYNLVRYLLNPIGVAVGERVVDPYSNYVWLLSGIFNFSYSAISGVFASFFVLIGMQYLLRPRTMIYPQLVMLVYVGMSYWWFFKTFPEVSGRFEPEMVWVRLTTPLGALSVFALASILMVKRNQPNTQLNKD